MYGIKHHLNIHLNVRAELDTEAADLFKENSSCSKGAQF